MEGSEPSVDELVDSVILAGSESGYRIGRDAAGRLQITDTGWSPAVVPLRFRFTEQQLRDYYTRLAAHAGKPGWGEHRVGVMDAADVDASR